MERERKTTAECGCVQCQLFDFLTVEEMMEAVLDHYRCHDDAKPIDSEQSRNSPVP